MIKKGIFLLLAVSMLSVFYSMKPLETKPNFKCTLIIKKKNYKIGETPQFKVQIKNLSDGTVYLIGSLDGSESKMRMPFCYFTIEKPAIDTLPNPICGNMNSLRVENFVEVKRKAKFDPYSQKEGAAFFTSFEMGRKENFRLAGKYKIQFHYSTESENIEKYLGDKTEADKTKLIELLAKVPKIKLESNVVEIRVK